MAKWHGSCEYRRNRIRLQSTCTTCGICGKPILDIKDSSCDHIIPTAPYKWYIPNGTDKGAKDYDIDNILNLTLVHVDCNVKKNDMIPTPEYIDSLYVSDESKQWAKDKLVNDKRIIQYYNKLFNIVLQYQGNRCYKCNRLITHSYQGNIRRKNNKRPRDLNNCKVLCIKCNIVSHR